jgi:phage tail-like protein
MAQVANPRKQFQFQVYIPGLNPFLCQKVRMSDVEFDMVEHGDTNFIVKTAGIKKVGNITIEKIAPADSPDQFIWAWVHRIQNTITGGGQLPSQYKETLLIEQYSNDGQTVVQRWEAAGCWPQKINGVEFDRAGSNNTIENIDFCVDDIPPVI